MENKKIETSLEIVEKRPVEIEKRIDDKSPMSIIQLALNSNADLDKIGKMMELQERWEKIEAKKAYTLAMAKFKKDPPVINKDRKVGYTSKRTGDTTGYNHATLGNVTSKINTSLAKHGLSAGWTTDQQDNTVSVTCTITHKLGHSESTTLKSAPDNTGNKNSIQAIASAITYLQRYTLLSLTGLATHDQDDDGKNSEVVECITEKQQNEIRDMLIASGSNEKNFLKYLNVDSIAAIPNKDYMRCINLLEAKQAKMEKK